jgi:hypothetical protein
MKNSHPRDYDTSDYYFWPMRQDYAGVSGPRLYHGIDGNNKSSESHNPLKYYFQNGPPMRVCGFVSFFFGWAIVWLCAVRRTVRVGQVLGVVIMVAGLASILFSQGIGK